MEISNKNPLLSTTSKQEDKKAQETGESTSVKTTKVDETPNGPVRKTYDFVFTNADDKFLESFSKITSSLPILDASFMRTKVEVNLINYHKEQITTELKSRLGDDFKMTEEMKQKIFNEAKQRAEHQGFSNIDMNNFLGYVNQTTAGNPLLQTDNVFFTKLQGMYNSVSIDSRG